MDLQARRKGNEMMQRIRKVMAQEGGFTLIELLIVIVILGILAAIVVFAVSGITDRGTTAACKADTESVTVAAEAFFAKSAVVPAVYATDIASLVTANLLHSSSTISGSTLTGNGYTVSYTGGGGATQPTINGNLTGHTTNDCK